MEGISDCQGTRFLKGLRSIELVADRFWRVQHI